MSMSTAVMTKRIAETSPRFRARMAGLFELLEALTSGFGQVIVPGMLIVSGNAAATAANILAHGLLLRFSVLATLIGVACHIAWTFLFYELFKPVNRSLSLLGAFIGLVAIAIQACSSVFQLAPLIIMEGGQSFSAFNVDQLQALTLMFLRFSGRAFNTYLAFFGIWCVLIGYLILGRLSCLELSECWRLLPGCVGSPFCGRHLVATFRPIIKSCPPPEKFR